jgi:sirohydrochlorin cobaltochelatase
MEFSRPTVEEAAQKLEKQGVKQIIFVNAPGLAMRSSHSLIDIPSILRGIKTRHQDMKIIYAPPGVDFDKMADVFVKRMNCALGKHVERKKIPSGEFSDEWGVVLIAHGDVPIDYLQNAKMEMTEEHIDKWSTMVRNWPRNEENDPLYCDSLELEKRVKGKVRYEIEVGYLEFSSPNLQEALHRLTARGVKKVYFIGGTGFMDRSSHTLVDIPKALAKLEEDNPDVEIEYVYPNIEQVCDDLSLMLVEKVNQAFENAECIA